MSDRDRVTAILTLADEAKAAYEGFNLDGHRAVRKFTGQAALEAPWLAHRLLEALDTIDKVKRLHAEPTRPRITCYVCRQTWPCPTWQALRGGNE